jgi:hypothetical protein
MSQPKTLTCRQAMQVPPRKQDLISLHRGTNDAW